MEEFPRENVEQDGGTTTDREQNLEIGEFALELTDEKTISEKSFAEAKRDGELPEGVRDEGDYREYLEEKGAREKEKWQRPRMIAEKIDSIEDENEKRIIVAMFPTLGLHGAYNQNPTYDYIIKSEDLSASSLHNFLLNERNDEYSANKLEELIEGNKIYLLGTDEHSPIDESLGLEFGDYDNSGYVRKKHADLDDDSFRDAVIEDRGTKRYLASMVKKENGVGWMSSWGPKVERLAGMQLDFIRGSINGGSYWGDFEYEGFERQAFLLINNYMDWERDKITAFQCLMTAYNSVSFQYFEYNESVKTGSRMLQRMKEQE